MSEMAISTELRPYYGETTTLIRWWGAVDGELVSELWINPETGEIAQVETAKAHQGSGYATALYRAAASTMRVYHAPAAHRTPEGDRFARSTGGCELPCLHGCCDGIPDFDEE